VTDTRIHRIDSSFTYYILS